MSCCGGNCGCGCDCKCGNGCGGCKMYPDLAERSTSEAMVLGVGPTEKAARRFFDEAQGEVAAANVGCKCGGTCTCDPCNCK